MATTYDGSIRINTQIDTAGVTTGLSTITSGLRSFQNSSSSLLNITPTVNTESATSAISSLAQSANNLTENTDDINVAVSDESANAALSSIESNVTTLDNTDPVITPTVDTTEAETATRSLATTATTATTTTTAGLGNVSTGVATVTAGLKKMAAAFGIAFSIQKVVEFAKESIETASDLNEVQNVVDTTFGSMSSSINDFASTATKKFGLSTLAAKQYTGTMGAMLKSMGISTSDAADMSTEMAGLAGSLASFYNLDTDTAFEKIRSGISGETEPLKQLGINLSEANLSAYALKQGMTTAYDKMSEQQKVLVRYKYLLSVTKDAQGDFSKTSKSWANQVRILKLNFQNLEATLGKAFIAVLTPVLSMVNELVSDLTYAASVFTDFIYKLTGTSAAASSTAAAVSDLADATDDSTDATDAASDSLADFDKLNTLSSSTTSSSTGTTATPTTTSTTGTTGTSGTTDNSTATKVKKSLDDILKLLSATAALFVLGTILLFSGHPLIGLALMVAGASAMAAVVTANWDTIKSLLQKPLVAAATLFVGAALLVIGAALCFSGAGIGLGLGLMLLGAAGMATTVAANWDTITKNLTNSFTAAEMIFAGLALLVVGAVIAFSGGELGLGIGLMAVGATVLGTAVALNWDTIKTVLTSPLGAAAGVFVGIALLVIGAVIAFSGSGLPLGIALMAEGAVTLATTIALNWDTIKTALTSPVGKAAGIFAGLALLALGAVLAFSGVALALGIALMAAGAVSLATTIALNWDAIKTALKDPIAKVAAIVGAALLVLGVILCFSGAAIPLGIAMIVAGASTVAAALNWDAINTALKDPIAKVLVVIGAALLALGVILCFSGAGIPLGIAMIIAGATTVAAALNWDSMKTALQDPIAKVVAIASAAALALGVILCFTGVGIPLGVGLILAGAAGLATAVAIDWDAIPDKIKGVWKNIKGFLNNYILAGVESFINGIIGGFNVLINFLDNLKVTAPDWVTKLTGITSFGFNITPFSTVKLPRLAAGAVIPPNRQFMAVLGDQTSGTNIETPLSTMTDAFKTAISEMGISGSSTPTVNITASADSASLIKYFKFNIDKETTRVGIVMATGGVRG
jgi:hypothetical protein